METTLIDERELLNKFIEKSKDANQILSGTYKRCMEKYRLNHNCYIGGLEHAISDEKMSLEQNIDNLFTAYKSNYMESVCFQCENIKMMNALDMIRDFLITKGLEADFINYRNNCKSKGIPELSESIKKGKTIIKI